MRVAGVIAEFNPFHNGHAHLCRTAREGGATHLVAVMSGNFVQRGDLAIAEKRLRTACALSCGVDLVLELPTPWAMATAQTFARGAVGLLKATGCVDTLCFGSECGDSARLARLADALEEDKVEMLLRMFLAQGMTYAKARQQALAEVCGKELARHIQSPNDLLGVEYLRQAKALGWHPALQVVRREGAGHHAAAPGERIASASWMRARGENLLLLAQYMPPAAAGVLRAAREDGLYPADPCRLETAILAKLRSLGPRELALLPDLSEGLENRLAGAIRAATSLEALAFGVKTKRYPMARVRRLILSAFLGIPAGAAAGTPPYLRVLGFRPRGRELLGKMKETATLPVEASPARLQKLGGRAGETARLEAAATDLYTLALPRPLPCGYELTAPGVWL